MNVQTNQLALLLFNYDTLLEKAYEHIISPIQEIDDYLKNEAIQIIKPHGSCNWVKVIDQYEIPKDHEVFLNDFLLQANCD